MIDTSGWEKCHGISVNNADVDVYRTESVEMMNKARGDADKQSNKIPLIACGAFFQASIKLIQDIAASVALTSDHIESGSGVLLMDGTWVFIGSTALGHHVIFHVPESMAPRLCRSCAIANAVPKNANLSFGSTAKN